jgi:hypothetical protein
LRLHHVTPGTDRSVVGYGPRVRRWVAVAVVVVFLFFALVLGFTDATSGGDWPGWDEGWALVVFPLGVPLALYAAAGLGRAGPAARVATIGTLAVWLWGAAVFVTWFFLG